MIILDIRLSEKCKIAEDAIVIFDYFDKNAAMKEKKTMINDDKKRRYMSM